MTRRYGVALRGGIVGLVAGAALLVAPSIASAATSYGYVWADEPTIASYTPDGGYQANSAGQLNTITRTGVGQYQIVFPGLARSTNGGTVNVTAYGGGGRSYCGVVSWGGTLSNGIVVNVRCADTTGAFADSQFDATYTVPPSKGDLAYVWANDPTSASYTPAGFYQFNSRGGTNTITRFGTGSYQVRLPGLGKSGGTVKATTYGPVSTRCKVSSWAPSGVDEVVDVRCFNSAGIPVDAAYTMTYARNRNLLGTASGYGYAWANQPGSPSYTPSTTYATTSPAGPISITRSAPGEYDVFFQSVGIALLSDVQITAYGSGSNECRVVSWLTVLAGQDVGVQCYDTNGNLADSFYTIQFIR